MARLWRFIIAHVSRSELCSSRAMHFCSVAAGNFCEFLPVSRSGHATVRARVRICNSEYEYMFFIRTPRILFFGCAIYFERCEPAAQKRREWPQTEESLHRNHCRWQPSGKHSRRMSPCISSENLSRFLCWVQTIRLASPPLNTQRQSLAIAGGGLQGHPHQHLTNVGALEEAQNSLRQVLEAINKGGAIRDFATFQPGGHCILTLAMGWDMIHDERFLWGVCACDKLKMMNNTWHLKYDMIWYDMIYDDPKFA